MVLAIITLAAMATIGVAFQLMNLLQSNVFNVLGGLILAVLPIAAYITLHDKYTIKLACMVGTIMPFIVSGAIMIEIIEFVWLFMCWPIIFLATAELEDY